jgi:hypothetical protein
MRRNTAQEIRAFLNGEGGPWDWDDFTSIPIEGDAVLDAVRLYCVQVYDIYPAGAIGGYCNEAGRAELLRLADLLESEAAIQIDAQGVPRPSPSK